ncbi:MAG: FGGY family carbohydrate kinase [Actinomycetota bacterium]|nr:FGGY family carbohydrate kinase [Actinomycetota bacterium]
MARTGCNLDSGHVAAKIAWLRAHEPEIDRDVASYLLPGSWVACQASGELAVDPSNASSTATDLAVEPSWPASQREARRAHWSAALALTSRRPG